MAKASAATMDHKHNLAWFLDAHLRRRRFVVNLIDHLLDEDENEQV